jgi:hypothetical protein
MKAIITSASEVRIDGQQSVGFNIIDNDDNILVSTSIDGDVDTLRDQISQTVAEYEAKAKSENRLKEGDVIS